ncbi:outer spore coat protein CotE [Halalkalibacterium halodurans]|jgi:spore coat protein E|uniref:Outer spore coat protein n=2 Tax=Halalkalibacterium halodurans TaxID=86665 RepID=Q9KAB9_HALH5|nr:outer spore coat protein CotE [Halalkalibacterium halodurans]MDY7222918.1 outer spore coat protein CotE [Halalkalibacterium halodurans]MDY7242139.1 outer spore coat protein CotE [Halalkalibacterium halodurans]MED3648207.1 outer spore coat protein CotE [Halalkalibacterium halodurans]MED4081198.1 outer spore coat protein CotE [Halalkalibacterium halodurans]MED4087033.1 outer spore coat protein CotE [Halalkalibacterium halodurans]
MSDGLNYREIITKAVCGKGRKFSQASHKISPSEKPSSILGCWIINHKYSADKKGENVEVQGSYDINVWFSYKNNTKTDVATQTVSYTDIIPLTMRDENVLSKEMDVVARPIQQPNTLEATIAESGVHVDVQVEREFVVECIGETKVAVAVNPDGIIEEIPESTEELELTEDEFEDLDPNFLQGELEE